jgi:hypothetical protein
MNRTLVIFFVLFNVFAGTAQTVTGQVQFTTLAKALCFKILVR